LIKDQSPYVKQSIFKTGWGVTGKSGINFFLKHAFTDVLVDYSYTYISSYPQEGVQSNSLNIGGLRAGLGLGVYF
jgi:hypothetical protein